MGSEEFSFFSVFLRFLLFLFLRFSSIFYSFFFALFFVFLRKRRNDCILLRLHRARTKLPDRASLHEFYVMTAELSPPEFFHVMADPINYTEKVGFPSVVS